MNQPQFDVFLAHNSQDKPQVRVVANYLKQRGLQVWLDEEQIPPGRPFQDVIQRAIQSVKSAAIFIGPKGLGKWQVMELRTLIGKLVEADIPVIPVLLPGVKEIPHDLEFLKQLNWVSFSNGLDDNKALDHLVWGITQEKPISEVQTDDLSSERGVNYTRLRDLAQRSEWWQLRRWASLIDYRDAEESKPIYLQKGIGNADSDEPIYLQREEEREERTKDDL